MRERLDVLLVQKGFFETREKAKRAVMAGLIIVDDKKIEKPGTQIKLDKDPDIRIKGEVMKYVSRGGMKLEKAIEVFSMDFNKKVILDVGASTGGFTDCSLQNGAEFVYAVDVGTNQLDWKLRNDDRVKSIENMHIKNLSPENLDNRKVDYVVMDVSFISITKVFKHLIKFMEENSKLMALIKPQFEVGKENVEKGGIVRDPSKHKLAIEKVIECAEKEGLHINGLDYSPITGTKGNIEYISIFSFKDLAGELDIQGVIDSSLQLKTGGK